MSQSINPYHSRQLGMSSFYNALEEFFPWQGLSLLSLAFPGFFAMQTSVPATYSLF